MQLTKHSATVAFHGRLGWSAVLAAGLIVGSSMPLGAQSPPPVQGTIALEGTMKQFYRAANVVVVSTMDGVEHMYHFSKDLVVHGGKGSGVDALEGLREGTTVVVHYTVSGAEASAQEIDLFGDEGLKITEGQVAKIDRRRQEITIRFANGTTETLQMTNRAAESARAAEKAGADAPKVIVYYSDEAGRKVVHYFRKTS
jgi:hypothetical protein